VSTWKKPQARRVRASPRAVACDRLRRPLTRQPFPWDLAPAGKTEISRHSRNQHLITRRGREDTEMVAAGMRACRRQEARGG
jgi:hypothetical protein